MEGLGTDDAHGLPLVLQPRAEPALPPPHGGSLDAFDISHGVNRKGLTRVRNKKRGNLGSNTLCDLVGGNVFVVRSVVSQVSELHRCGVCTRDTKHLFSRLRKHTVQSLTSQGAISPAVSTRGQSDHWPSNNVATSEHAVSDKLGRGEARFRAGEQEETNTCAGSHSHTLTLLQFHDRQSRREVTDSVRTT